MKQSPNILLWIVGVFQGIWGWPVVKVRRIWISLAGALNRNLGSERRWRTLRSSSEGSSGSELVLQHEPCDGKWRRSTYAWVPGAEQECKGHKGCHFQGDWQEEWRWTQTQPWKVVHQNSEEAITVSRHRSLHPHFPLSSLANSLPTNLPSVEARAREFSKSGGGGRCLCNHLEKNQTNRLRKQR